jgi:hypothetical protein
MIIIVAIAIFVWASKEAFRHATRDWRHTLTGKRH